jgi:hypothetical protein
MKRILIAGAVVVACLGVLIFLAADRRERPRFITGDLPAYAPYKYLHFTGPRPQIATEKLWLSTWSGSNDFHNFLFDLSQRRIIGRLVNGAPLALNSNATKVLCLQRELHRPGLLHEARSILSDLLLRKNRPALDFEMLWVLDLKNNSAVKVGRVPRRSGSGSLAFASPDFRHLLIRGEGVADSLGTEHYLCNLESNTLTKIATDWPMGWWNERQLLDFSPGAAHQLYDIHTQQFSTLLTEAQITSFLENAGLAPKLHDTMRFFTRRGHVTGIYLAPPPHNDEGDSRLIKLDPTNSTLSFVSRKFNRKWRGELDPGDRYFLFTTPGESAFHGVYLHDFQTDEVRTLVPPTGTPVWYHPFFHGDKVLYVRSNALWQMDMRGSNGVLLFPP